MLFAVIYYTCFLLFVSISERRIALAEYHYKASTAAGKIVTGKMNVSSEDVLRTNLRARDLYLISAEDKSKKNVIKLKYNELSDFCRELSSMLGAGLSLTRSMSIITSRDISKKLNIVFSDINTHLMRGNALSEAMTLMKGVFPDLMINMIKAGEASGQLDHVCEELAVYYEKQYRTQTDIKSAMTYPAILSVIVVLVIIVIFIFIFPTLEGVFEGMELPLITQIMVGFSHLLLEQWYIFVIILGALVLGVLAFKSNYTCMYHFDKFILKCPVKKLAGTIYTSRFARTMASLYSSGISILGSLNISKNVIGNRYITAQFNSVVDAVRRGETLSSSLLTVDGFDKKLASVLVVGEETGQMDKLLTSMADTFDYESTVAINKLVKMLEPIMIAIMAGIILVVMLSVLLPIFDLYSSIDSM